MAGGVNDTSSRAGTPNQRNRISRDVGGRNLATVESVKSTSRRKPQTPKTRSSALRGFGLSHGSNGQAVTSTKEILERLCAPLWDTLVRSHQSLLEKLALELNGNLIKELDAVTIHFKVGVPSKCDLACRFICHGDKGHTLKLYISGLASTPSLTIDLNKHRTSLLVASTIIERVQNIIAGVTARIPARNQVISAAVPSQNPQNRRMQTHSRLSTYDTTTRMGTNSRYDYSYLKRDRNSPKVDLESKLRWSKYMSTQLVRNNNVA